MAENNNEGNLKNLSNPFVDIDQRIPEDELKLKKTSEEASDENKESSLKNDKVQESAKVEDSKEDKILLKEDVDNKTVDFPIRKIYKRNIALSIIFTILTFGIYGIFWQYEIAKETNEITNDKSGFTPALVVFLSIITCGIYAVYWSYQCGKKQAKFLMNKKQIDSGCYVLYLVLMICNYIVPGLIIISYAFMQATLNKILGIAEEDQPDGLYTRDSSIFNRPFWSAIILIFLSIKIPEIIVSTYQLLMYDVPANLIDLITEDASSILLQGAIQESADQVINANTPLMISQCVLSIGCAVGVLWWFKMRYQHSSYTGVLVWRNFGRACLFGLPGLLFAAMNLFDFSIQNFKFGIILLGLVPAFIEEISFRGLIIPNWMRIYNRSKGIWLSLFVSAAIFGIFHVSNLLVGADLSSTIFQVFYAFTLGILFAGIFIRTGNLWIPIILHGLIDIISLMTNAALEQGAIQSQPFVFTWDLIPIFVICAFFIFWGIWLCRPKKHEEICNLWADKWGSALMNK